MACTVRTMFYDNNTSKEITDLTGAEMLINGVSVIGAEGGISTQENTSLIFSFDNQLPGGGGYAFKEWQYSIDGGNYFIPASETTVTVDATELYYLEVRCYLNPNKYKITYNYNNPSSIGDYEQEVLFNDESTQLAGAPSYKGYVFKGWRIGSELYAALSIYTPTAADVIANGEWVDNEDSSLLPGEELTYEDEETGVEETVNLLKGIAAVLKALGSSGSGNSWNIGGSSKKAGSSYTPSSEGKKTATAERATQKFWVKYALNGGNKGVAFNPVQIVDGQSVTLPEGPVKSGYTFSSWKSSGGNGYFSGGDSVVIKKNTTFTAQYKKTEQKVTVKFLIDNTIAEISVGDNERLCEIGKSYSKCYEEGKTEPTEKALPTPEIKKPGYTFEGWYTSSNGGGNNIESGTTVIIPNNHNLYGFIKQSGTITANPGGIWLSNGTSGSKEYHAAKGSSIAAAITDSPTKEGYYKWVYDAKGKPLYREILTNAQIEGWAYNNGNFIGNDTITENGQKVSVYAKFKQRVIFDIGSKLFSIPDDVFVVHGEKYSNLPSITEDPTFTGWYTSATGGTQYSANTTCLKTAGDTLHLYAQYSENEQFVEFDLVYAESGAPEDMKFNRPGTYSGLPNPEREGYTFKGWYTAKSGGTKIEDGGTVTNDERLTVYAIWDGQQQVHFYGEQFRFDDGSTIKHKYYDKGNTYYDFPKPNTGKSNAPSSSGSNNYIGYIFKYYTTSQSGGTRINEGDTVSDADELWLYAQYEQNTTEYTMTFDPNGGTCTTTASDRYEGQQMGSLPIATKTSSASLSMTRDGEDDAKTFAGWKVDDEIIDSSYVMTTDKTATAQWKDKIVLYYAVDANTPPPHIPQPN